MDNASKKISENFSLPSHDQNLTLEGLDDLFSWASEMVADGQDVQTKKVNEQKLRRRVLEVVQQAREQKATNDAGTEVAYLQRRVMALLNRLSGLTEELSHLKQIILAQTYAMQAIPDLEAEVKELEKKVAERDQLRATQESLMNTLSRIKIERDILDDLLRAVEMDNDRLGRQLRESREQVAILSAKRWWHYFMPKFASKPLFPGS